MALTTTPGPLRVATWHWANYRRLWRINLLSTFVQPVLYLLGLGVGIGTLVNRHSGSIASLGGVPYVAYVAPGLIVTAAMAIAAEESMWPVLANLKWTRGYYGIAATPLGARDIVLGHATWIAARTGLAASAVSVALALFHTTRSWGLPLTVPVAMIVGLAFAMPIMAFSCKTDYDGAFAGIQRFVIIPLFLFGGAFYPLTKLPTAVQWLAKAAPLWHGVVVARGFTTRHVDWASVCGHLAYVAAWAVAGTIVSTRRMRDKLST